jgi:signal peptidase I
MFDDLTQEGDGESAPPADLHPATLSAHDTSDASEAALARARTSPPSEMPARGADATHAESVDGVEARDETHYPTAGSDDEQLRPYDEAATYGREYDPYADLPASLELAYGPADVGLSPRAYDRAFPYESAGERRRRRAGGVRVRRYGRELVETLVLALLIFFAVKAVVQNFRVEGQSMEPSLNSNEYLLVNKAIYYRFDTGTLHRFLPFIPDDNGNERHLFRAPRRGDVIVFRFPLDTSRDFIKRVIGVPGDTVEVRDGKVFINGDPLVENYILSTPDYTYAPKTVPAGQYFVLGDNRRNSYDSHAWHSQCSQQQTCDFVPEENIIGQAWVAYWPFDVFGFVNNKVIKPHAP